MFCFFFVWNVSMLTLFAELYKSNITFSYYASMITCWLCDIACIYYPPQMFYFILFIWFHKMFPWCFKAAYLSYTYTVVYLINLKEWL